MQAFHFDSERDLRNMLSKQSFHERGSYSVLEKND